ncbi:MAG TPA: hypothetical protein VKY92_16380 [Verrucomicrobiae bacterium]|nr:hypothetical protein [Verrucomicrobiae bacterium]
MTTPVECPSCKAPLAEPLLNQPELVPCPSCRGLIHADVFPAIHRELATGSSGEALVIETEAGCFYHPQKKAVTPCDGCGRFLCALCDCELHGEHFCPTCLETGRKKGKIKRLEQERTLYDSIALALAVYPLLIFYFTVVTAPISLILAIRFWNAPRSIVHRTKIRFVVAIILSSLQLIGWGVGIYFLTTHWKSHG